MSLSMQGSGREYWEGSPRMDLRDHCSREQHPATSMFSNLQAIVLSPSSFIASFIPSQSYHIYIQHIPFYIHVYITLFTFMYTHSHDKHSETALQRIHPARR